MNTRLACALLLPTAVLTAVLVFPGGRLLPALGLAASLGIAWKVAAWVRALDRRIHYLEGTLDAVPQPLTVTDMNMRWIFVNKTTEGLLRKKRDQVVGRHCSEWQAHICNTDKCGIQSLRGGCPRTFYEQDMGNGTHRSMQVDTSYITDPDGQRIGHVEIVTDVQAQSDLTGVHTRLAASIEEISGTMAEIEAQTRANAGNAKEALRLADQSRQHVQTGVEQIAELNQAMNAITQTSQEITKINKAIDQIAFQTNILALNAAVEAARAGEAGTGFAVVADEVRSLASRSADAAKRASTLIEQSTAAVTRGGALVERVTSALSEVDSESQKVDNVIQQIASASSEQSQGVSAVTSAISHLEKMASQPAG